MKKVLKKRNLFLILLFFGYLHSMQIAELTIPPLQAELFAAVENNNIKKVEDLLRQGVDPNFKVADASPLAKAMLNKNREIVRLLFSAQANPNISQKLTKHVVPIFFLIHYNFFDDPAWRIELTRLFLENPAFDINAIDPVDNNTILHTLLDILQKDKIENPAIFKIISDYRFKGVNHINDSGYTPLSLALQVSPWMNALPIVQAVLNRPDLEINKINKKGKTPFDFGRKASIQIKNLLRAKGAKTAQELNIQTAQSSTLQSAPFPSLKMQMPVRPKFAPPPTGVRTFEDVIKNALKPGNENILTEMLLSPISLDYKSFEQILSSLILRNLSIDLLKIALAHPFAAQTIANWKGSGDNNLLHIAVIAGNENAVRELLKFNINVNAINSNNKTPVDLALTGEKAQPSKLEIYQNIQKMLKAKGGRPMSMIQSQITAEFPPDIYQKLGVNPDATPLEILGLPEYTTMDNINITYTKLRFHWHPERNPDPLSAQVTELIRWAYEQLKSGKYDRHILKK